MIVRVDVVVVDSAATVDIGTVLDADQVDDARVVVQAVDDPIRAAAGSEVTGELAAEWPSNPSGLLAQRSVTELPDGERHRQR